MADNKRLSLGGRVATPRVGNIPAPAMSVETAIARCIGAKVRVTTIAPASQTYEQHILAVSPAAAVLTLTPTFPPATPHPRQLLVPLASIQTFTLLSLPSPPGSATNSAASSTGASSKAAPAPLSAAPPPPLVDPATQAQLLRSAVARAHSEDARRGRGVGQEAQEIFDAIARTLPARWDGSSIVVLDAVVIAPPYRSEDCRAAKSAQAQMLLRVRKVLESERKKIAGKTAGSPAAEPRKGG